MNRLQGVLILAMAVILAWMATGNWGDHKSTEIEALFRWSPYFGEEISNLSDRGFLRIYSGESTGLNIQAAGELLVELRLPPNSQNKAIDRCITYGPITKSTILKSGRAKSFKIFDRNKKMVIIAGPIEVWDLNTYNFREGYIFAPTELKIEQPAPEIEGDTLLFDQEIMGSRVNL
jgi:hypothetical protein